MLTTLSNLSTNPLRDTITNAYRMDESECLKPLLAAATFPADELAKIATTAGNLVVHTREFKKQQNSIDSLLHKYDLSSDEGVALMCLAEALLRIPDKPTMDKFISDKLSSAEWKDHLGSDNSFFINAATWSLLITGKVYAPTNRLSSNLLASLMRAGSRVGSAMLRPIIFQMMKIIGKQFVLGEDIESAVKKAQSLEEKGYTFSYDMLGESARTKADAEHYLKAYIHSIEIIGKTAPKSSAGSIHNNPSISIKLSALHARYEYTQRERIMQELPPLVLKLAQLAKSYDISMVIDAEEADRLDLALDIFAEVFQDPSLNNWEGLGLALQAYQKRTYYVLDWLVELSKQAHKQIIVRLVKGAYWDAEIKQTQINGFKNYPVFTRKHSTDVSYLACAKKLFAHPKAFYAQFGTHNAYSVAAVMALGANSSNFEFQCLHGMGRALYDQIVAKEGYHLPTRIYAPVGSHRDLLGYLVRRLLENGANSSFINQLADEQIPIEKIITDPVARIASLEGAPHPAIPLPKNLYPHWKNSQGIDLSNLHNLIDLKKNLEASVKEKWTAASIVAGKKLFKETTKPVFSPSDTQLLIGHVCKVSDAAIEKAIATAWEAKSTWNITPVAKRCDILERAADLLQAEMPQLVAMLTREGGKAILDCLSEAREAIDYCRYYAYQAREDFKPKKLPGPTGELNQLFLHPRGVIACISPWNFPLAIFTGQVVAALAAGNCVIAKPAEQTPLIACKVIELLHLAGIPKEALQLVIGPGSQVGPKLTSDSRIDGIMFTGSTQTAKSIERSLAAREGEIAMFVAETGGQNAMIVDSSALPEQVVIDIVQSAFNSAGQRCSALRVLFLQEEIAPKIITMLSGFMQELTLGEPSLLSTDVGPVIDPGALEMLNKHFAQMMQKGKLLAQMDNSQTPNGYFFAPCAFEIESLDLLKEEIFGPILHVIRYKSTELDKVLQAIQNTGYGLTLGIHSRIDATIEYVTSRMPVGNMYVNRNMIGAVVGVQPFGGERLSGTGPKAGGPHYLPRLCVERTTSINTTAVGGNAQLVSLLEES